MSIPSDVKEAEAKALKLLFEERSEMTQAQFAGQYGLGTPGLVWQYLNGHRPLNLVAATKFAVGLNVKIDEFSSRLAEEARAAAAVTGSPDPNAEIAVADILNKLPPEARQAWADHTSYLIHRNEPLLAQEDLRRFDQFLKRFTPNPTDKAQ